MVPRDAWLINRLTTQSGPEFFLDAIGSQADQMEACAKATSIDDLFLRLEACGAMLRIHQDAAPSMFRYATVSLAETEVLRQIRDVVRRGRVRALGADHMELDQGRVATAPGTLFIDCTATALSFAPPQPIFQDGRIVLQVVRMPLPTFSAALIAHVEAAFDDDTHKNKLCAPIPFPKTLSEYPRAVMANMRNQMQWGQDKGLRACASSPSQPWRTCPN